MLTLEASGIFLRFAVIVCMLDVRLLMGFVGVDVLADCFNFSIVGPAVLYFAYRLPILLSDDTAVGFASLCCLLVVIVIICGENYIRLSRVIDSLLLDNIYGVSQIFIILVSGHCYDDDDDDDGDGIISAFVS